MARFVQGILIENEEGAKYEGTVYDRFLKVRLADGQVISIFDPFGPISTGLAVNEIYEMVLVTFPVSVSYFTANPPSLASGLWQGTIVDAHWLAPRGYRTSIERLYTRDWALLETSVGYVLMDGKEIKAPSSNGGVVQWKNVRLDLYAVE